MTAQRQEVVIGVFRRRADADACFNSLLSLGYLSSDVNIMMSTHTRAKDYAWDYEVEAMEMAGRGTVRRRSGSRSDDDSTDETDEVVPGNAAGDMAVEGVAIGGSIGTAVGATLAAIAAVGTSLVIPGLNLVIAGPLMAALAGGGAGALTGGLVGGLVGLGIPEQDAEVYNQALRTGGVVMSVTVIHADASRVQSLMIEHGGEQVTCCHW